MSAGFGELFGGGGGQGQPRISVPCFTSRTWVAPQDGIAILRGMGAGGGGAKAAATAQVTTGGYSGAWGCIVVRLLKGDTVQIVIGAGGPAATTAGSGTAGGNTTITVAGVTYTAPGGPGGLTGATTPTVPNGPALPGGWHFGAGSVKPGVGGGATSSGGAGVDILMQGSNATTSHPSGHGGGTGSAAQASVGGGAMPGGLSALGQAPADPAWSFDASQGEWGISFFGGSGGNASDGGNGGGGSAGKKGGNGGGGGSGGSGGLGGGGGGGQTTGGSVDNGGMGGNGYAHIEFFADTGV